jgi:hypothetical protein
MQQTPDSETNKDDILSEIDVVLNAIPNEYCIFEVEPVTSNNDNYFVTTNRDIKEGEKIYICNPVAIFNYKKDYNLYGLITPILSKSFYYHAKKKSESEYTELMQMMESLYPRNKPLFKESFSESELDYTLNVIANKMGKCAFLFKKGHILYGNMSNCFNHSCLPNCNRYFDGYEMTIEAIRDIKAGEELTIPYLSCVYDDKERRKTTLELNLGFDCNCIACLPGSNRYPSELLWPNQADFCLHCGIPKKEVECDTCNASYCSVSCLETNSKLIHKKICKPGRMIPEKQYQEKVDNSVKHNLNELNKLRKEMEELTTKVSTTDLPTNNLDTFDILINEGECTVNLVDKPLSKEELAELNKKQPQDLMIDETTE